MSIDNFLKIFNSELSFQLQVISGHLYPFWAAFAGELSPASAFMTGKIKVKGDLSKALTLEKVMKAAAEAAAKK